MWPRGLRMRVSESEGRRPAYASGIACHNLSELAVVPDASRCRLLIHHGRKQQGGLAFFWAWPRPWAAASASNTGTGGERQSPCLGRGVKKRKRGQPCLSLILHPLLQAFHPLFRRQIHGPLDCPGPLA